ncbi:MAG: hypothetical protein ABH817_00540 [archaeon]
MVELQCSKCSYQFDWSKVDKNGQTKMPKLCPYCGGEGTVKRVPSANDILNQVKIRDDEE